MNQKLLVVHEIEQSACLDTSKYEATKQAYSET